MLIIKECNRNILCVDCDNTECNRHGDIEQDCPKYRCDNDVFDCNNCTFMKEYQKQMRKHYKENNIGGNKNDS